MKKLMNLTFLIFCLCLPSVLLNAQVYEMKGKAKVLEFKKPYKKIVVDMTDDDKDFIQEMTFEPETTVTNKKGKTLALEYLVPGTEVEIVAERINYKNQLKKVILLKKWTGGEVELDGLLESFDPETEMAFIDGERVKLGTGVKIKGKSRYKKKTFKDFSTLTAGNIMTIKGIRNEAGYIIANSATIEENEFTKSDKELRGALGDEFSHEAIQSIAVPEELKKYTNQLDQGYAQFGDARFKLVDNLKVQAYVNYIGNKVVPQWQKNIPFDAMERIRFRFYVIENPTFNAFALPNGMIFVHSGLLEILDNEAQLAAVLGHEVAHVTYEHARERYERQKKLNVAKKVGGIAFRVALRKYSQSDVELAKLLSSDFFTGGVEAAVGLVKQLEALPPQSRNALRGLALGIKGVASNVHGHDNENQSDRVGLYYMQEAGYDPREAANVWRKFMDLTSDKDLLTQLEQTTKQWMTTSDMYPYQNPMASIGDMLLSKVINSALDNWFSSHPKATERYRNLNQLVATHYVGEDFSDALVMKEEYEEIKLLVKRK